MPNNPEVIVELAREAERLKILRLLEKIEKGEKTLEEVIKILDAQ